MKVQGKSTGKRNSKGRIVEVGKILVCLKHSEEVGVVRAEETEQQEEGWRDKGGHCRCGKKIALSSEWGSFGLDEMVEIVGSGHIQAVF